MGVAEYRQSALSATLDGNHPLHLLPSVPDDVTSVSDVGCHAGDILEALKLPRHRRQVGCDVNREALALAESICLTRAFTWQERNRYLLTLALSICCLLGV
jgi:hypothetical protein